MLNDECFFAKLGTDTSENAHIFAVSGLYLVLAARFVTAVRRHRERGFEPCFEHHLGVEAATAAGLSENLSIKSHSLFW